VQLEKPTMKIYKTVFYRDLQSIEEDLFTYKKIRDEVMTEFEEKPKTVLVVHWDGKLMINSTSGLQ
jgi:hypothetical protein